MNSYPIRLAIIGMGGFAGEHHRVAHALEKQGECRVICACDPNPAGFQEAMEQWEFGARGIPVYADYTEMLDAHRNQLDMVTVPTPIPLHAPMHRAVVERGLACYLEKPPTLDFAELEEMLAVEANALWLTQVGFQLIAAAELHAMKRRVLSGEFGAVQWVGLLGLAPRPTGYFTRAIWAGRLKAENRLVLDSAMGNAMAHYLHNLLFWAEGNDVLAWEEAASVRAEMYRAHAIENMDTLFARGVCRNGVEMRIAASHACDGKQHLQQWIECERATIRHTTLQSYQIDWHDGTCEEMTVAPRDLLADSFLAYFRYLRGETDRPLTCLADTRPFVGFYDLAYVAAKQIVPVSLEHVTYSPAPNGEGEYVAINGIRQACETFLSTGRFPSQQGAPWGGSGGEAPMEELGQLRRVIDRMYAAQ
jgi:predicted dehydrogenase